MLQNELGKKSGTGKNNNKSSLQHRKQKSNNSNSS
jgi:hypothetical protein